MSSTLKRCEELVEMWASQEMPDDAGMFAAQYREHALKAARVYDELKGESLTFEEHMAAIAPVEQIFREMFEVVEAAVVGGPEADAVYERAATIICDAIEGEVGGDFWHGFIWS